MNCVICNSQSISKKRVLVSPFIARRVWNKMPFFTYMMKCKDCGLLYSVIRPSDDEMARLYKDYRGIEYQRLRQRYEPFYTKKLNDIMGSSELEINNRQDLLVDMLKSVGLTEFRTILDYGGDRGQMIPVVYNAERYVYDISNVDLVEGVKRLTDHREFDLIMCSGLLEHASDPLGVISKLKEYSHTGTILYIEVPDEEKNNIVSMPMLNGTIIASVLSQLRSRILHEHLNYFTEKSLRLVLKDFELLYFKTVDIDWGWNRTRAICCLARVK